jgi:hypothetical protein
MIRPLALLLCLAGDASAQDRAEWPGIDGTGSLTMTADGADYIVTLRNVGTTRQWGDDVEVLQLDLDGFAIVAQVWSYNNPTADTLVVFPPAGWVAIPPTLDVQERQSGSVRLVMQGLS